MNKKLPPLSVMPSVVWQDSRLSKTDFRVLGALCARRNKRTTFCFPSIETISADIGVDKAHVKKARKRLRGFGYISWTPPGIGAGKSCRYTIHGFDGLKKGGKFYNEGGGTCPPNEGDNCPPNIEENIELITLRNKHTSSPNGDATDRSFEQKVAILDNKLRRGEFMEDDLQHLGELHDQAFDGSKDETEQVGYVTRVYEDVSDTLGAKPPWKDGDE